MSYLCDWVEQYSEESTDFNTYINKKKGIKTNPLISNIRIQKMSNKINQRKSRIKHSIKANAETNKLRNRKIK